MGKERALGRGRRRGTGGPRVGLTGSGTGGDDIWVLGLPLFDGGEKGFGAGAGVVLPLPWFHGTAVHHFSHVPVLLF